VRGRKEFSRNNLQQAAMKDIKDEGQNEAQEDNVEFNQSSPSILKHNHYNNL